MSRSELVQMRMGIKQCPFPYGMADWFEREPNYIVSAIIDTPIAYFNCTFINCQITNAMVQNSELTGCSFEYASITGSIFPTGGLVFQNLTVNGDLTLGQGGTISGASSYLVEPDPIQVALSFAPSKKKKSKLPKKLEKGWK